MHYADVAIIGGGIAGSTAAAILGKSGLSCVMIDVHQTYPEDFRCEKIETKHFKLLRRTGLGQAITAVASPFDELWIARKGHLVLKRQNDQYGIAYPDFVNAVRAQIPETVRFICGRVESIITSSSRQLIKTRKGEEISARLVILATGNNNDTSRQQVRITREDVSKCHSISVGFDLKPTHCDEFGFKALTYFGEKPEDRIAYMSLFPMRGVMRTNIFLYRHINDPWLAALRQAPQATIFAALPHLKRLLGDFDVISKVLIRPIDLYRTKGYRQPGIVLVGDSFATSCPAAGTGLLKALNDVVHLCEHIPAWMATDGMGTEKISTYYDDPAKIACDSHADHLAHYMRSLTLDQGARWRITRWGWLGIDLKDNAMKWLRASQPVINAHAS